MENSAKKRISVYIRENYKPGKSILLSQLMEQFPSIRPGSIRETLRCLIMKGALLRIKPGLYQLPCEEVPLTLQSGSVMDAIETLYLKDKRNNPIGYLSGLNFANKLGLTTQTAAVDYIISNNVANKKREIKINNIRFIINRSRYVVNRDNYKLLQVLDLLPNLKQYSDLKDDESLNIIKEYLCDVKLPSEKIAEIVGCYPSKAQIVFFKAGLQNDITSPSMKTGLGASKK